MSERISLTKMNLLDVDKIGVARHGPEYHAHQNKILSGEDGSTGAKRFIATRSNRRNSPHMYRVMFSHMAVRNFVHNYMSFGDRQWLIGELQIGTIAVWRLTIDAWSAKRRMSGSDYGCELL